MADRPVLNDGTLVWLGEHWLNAVRADEDAQPSGWFSLYHTRYSAAGEGHALQLVVPDEDLRLIATDNPALGRWMADRFFAQSSVQTPDVSPVPATFRREGRTDLDPAWVVEVAGRRVTARWSVAQPPVLAYGPFGPAREFFTALFFTDQSTIEVDGRRVAGRPYARDIWEHTIGGQRSSSVFALAEACMEPAPA